MVPALGVVSTVAPHGPWAGRRAKHTHRHPPHFSGGPTWRARLHFVQEEPELRRPFAPSHPRAEAGERRAQGGLPAPRPPLFGAELVVLKKQPRPPTSREAGTCCYALREGQGCCSRPPAGRTSECPSSPKLPDQKRCQELLRAMQGPGAGLLGPVMFGALSGPTAPSQDGQTPQGRDSAPRPRARRVPPLSRAHAGTQAGHLSSSRLLFGEQGHCGTCLVGPPGSCQPEDLRSSRELGAHSWCVWGTVGMGQGPQKGGGRSPCKGHVGGNQSHVPPRGRPGGRARNPACRCDGLVCMSFLKE